ncbi:Uncharacterised protein [Mycobacteroides abscessus subsp. abscessus]|nr:Uncharacterised protein [Mycobacteroides abscessus subsp. abscessus]
MEDRTQRIHADDLSAQKVQGHLRSRHVGNHQVVDHRMAVGEPDAGVDPHRRAEHRGSRELAPVLQQSGPEHGGVILGDVVCRGNGVESLNGIIDVGLEPREHAGHLISAWPVRLLVHRHRHHGDQRVVRELTAIIQILA